MNDQYKVGTVCIGQNYFKLAHRNNMECEIIEGLEMRTGKNSATKKTMTHMVYLVRWNDGSVRGVPPHNLRKPKEPPKQSDSQWADEAVRKLKKQSSDHVAGGSKVLIPEETA